MKLQTNVMNYGGNGVVISTPQPKAAGKPVCACQHKHAEPAVPASNGTLDFTKMTSAEKVAYHKALGSHPGVTFIS